MRCSTCRWFDRYTERADGGVCRINPPETSGWPLIGYPDQNWCGKWEAQPSDRRTRPADIERPPWNDSDD